MKRTKEWWGKLTPIERIQLHWLERGQHHSTRSGYIPDDMVECGNCGTPTLGYGLCEGCSELLGNILQKANGK